ncbi:MAG: UvrD-helicase domain-containing protein [Flavobacteriales bacterium]|nr:UvrD-helicase domain-containing protein [Flavobacteriales bacterium]
MASGLTITQASAGSGKTYALVFEYLRLALEEQGDFSHIMAITFTNKAAAEMKRRTLLALEDLALNKDIPLRTQLQDALGIGAEELSERALRVRRRMLHQFYKIQFSTIDALLQAIVRNMARELGISAGYALETQIEVVKKELLEAFYSYLDQDPDLLQWLFEYLEVRQQNEQSWDIDRALENFMDHLFNENTRELFKDGWPDMKEARRLKMGIEDEVKKIWESWKSATQALVQKLNEVSLSLDDVSARQPYGSLLRALAEGCAQPEQFISDSRILKKISQLKDCPEFALKSNLKAAQKRAFETAVASGLQSSYLNWRQRILEDHARLHTLCMVQREIFRYGLLSTLAYLLEQWKKERQTQLMQDAAALLAELKITGDADFLYEKTSQYVRHLMMDEFQDTSLSQWNSLQPLIKETLSNGGFVYAVGDPKQSIYGWRGARPEVFQHLLPQTAREAGQEAHVEILNNNHRSAPEIVRFNNAFFRLLSENLEDLLKICLQESISCQEVQEGIRDIQATFQFLKQEPAQTTMTGSVALYWLCLEKPKEQPVLEEGAAFDTPELEETTTLEPKQDSPEDLFEATLKMILLEWASEGFGPEDVAVLVRNNKEADKYADSLTKILGSGELWNGRAQALSPSVWNPRRSPVVDFLVSALRYLAQPHEPSAQGALYLGYQLLQGDPPGRAAASLVIPGAVEEWIASFPWPKGRVSDTVLHWVEHFDLWRFREETPYIFSFLDKVAEFESGHPSTVRYFLEWWENHADVSAGMPDEEGPLKDYVRIFTMHSCKGLQFPCVIAAFPVHGGLENNWDSVWLPVDHAEGVLAGKIFPFRRTQAAHQYSLTRSAFLKEYIKQFQEALNLLYVAFTRPQKKLAAILPYKKSKDAWGYLTYQFFNNNVPPEKLKDWNELMEAGGLRIFNFPTEEMLK